MANIISTSALMAQYDEMKQKYPDAILMFRVGDFYEMFCDDAVDASEILGIILTSRLDSSKGRIHLTGFPKDALDKYLPKLVRAGKRVAICEQIKTPSAPAQPELPKTPLTEVVEAVKAATPQECQQLTLDFGF